MAEQPQNQRVNVQGSIFTQKQAQLITCTGVAIVVFGAGLAGYGHGNTSLVGFVIAVAAIPAIRLKPRIKGPIWTGVVIVSWSVGALMVSGNAEQRAQAFCARFPSGASLTAAATAAAEEGEPRLRRITSTEVSVAYFGASMLDRHFCLIEGKDGLVSQSKYRLID